MVEASLVASAAVTALLLLAVAVAVARGRHRHPTLSSQAAGGGIVSGSGESIDRWMGSPSSWFASFLLVTFGAAAAAMLVVVEGVPFAGLLLVAAVGAVALGVTLGTYAAGRNSGLGSAGSTFVTAVLIGTVVIVGVTLRLFTF